MRFMIVDDDLAVLRLMAASLERAGHSTAVFHSALAALADYTEQDFDYLITDYQMSGMDGEELITEMWTDNGVKPSCVIVVSGSADAATIQKLESLGIAGFVAKPVVPTTFAAEIEQIASQTNTEQ